MLLHSEIRLFASSARQLSAVHALLQQNRCYIGTILSAFSQLELFSQHPLIMHALTMSGAWEGNAMHLGIPDCFGMVREIARGAAGQAQCIIGVNAAVPVICHATLSLHGSKRIKVCPYIEEHFRNAHLQAA